MSFAKYQDGRARFEDHLTEFYDRLTDDPYNFPLYPDGSDSQVPEDEIRLFYSAEWRKILLWQEPPAWQENAIRSNNGRTEHGVILFHITIVARTDEAADDVKQKLRELKDAIWELWPDMIADIQEKPWNVSGDQAVLPVDLYIRF